MTKLSTYLTLVPTLAIAAAAANAHDHAERHLFPIEIAAAEARAAERFEAADTNGDSLLSRAEFDAAPPHPRHFMPKGRGARDFHHGTLDDATFAQLDTDGSGELSQAELAPEHRAAARRAAMQTYLFSRLDLDGDGSITLAEMSARLETLRAADADADGLVTKEELRGHRLGASGVQG